MHPVVQPIRAAAGCFLVQYDPAAEKLIDGTLASGSTLVVDADENGEIVLN